MTHSRKRRRYLPEVLSKAISQKTIRYEQTCLFLSRSTNCRILQPYNVFRFHCTLKAVRCIAFIKWFSTACIAVNSIVVSSTGTGLLFDLCYPKLHLYDSQSWSIPSHSLRIKIINASGVQIMTQRSP